MFIAVNKVCWSRQRAPSFKEKRRPAFSLRQACPPPSRRSSRPPLGDDSKLAVHRHLVYPPLPIRCDPRSPARLEIQRFWRFKPEADHAPSFLSRPLSLATTGTARLFYSMTYDSAALNASIKAAIAEANDDLRALSLSIRESLKLATVTGRRGSYPKRR